MNSAARAAKSRKLKKLAKKRGQQNLCFYCGRGMSTRGDDPQTVEHLVAKSRGGGNEIENLRLAHRRCNEAVASLPVEIKLKLAGNMERGILPEWAKPEDPAWLQRLIRMADRDPSWAKAMALNATDDELDAP